MTKSEAAEELHDDECGGLGGEVDKEERKGRHSKDGVGEVVGEEGEPVADVGDAGDILIYDVVLMVG